MTNLKINNIYQWQIEYKTCEGQSQILNRYDNGREQSSKSVDPATVIRVSLLPIIQTLPRHDVLIHAEQGDKFIKWFGRMIFKNYQPAHYLNCVQTNRYRVWVHHTGEVWITNPNYEVYL